MLNIEAYRQLIHTHGERFRWLKAMPSDRYDPHSGFNLDRQDVHSDRGHVYVDMGIFRGLVTAQKRDMLHPDFGWIQAGELWLTTMPDEVRLGPLDKVVLLERAHIERERLKKGEDLLGQRYPVRVLLVADSSRTYSEGTDWRLDPAQGKIVWLEGGNAPADGAIYAVEYEYNPVYWYLGESMREPRPVFGFDGPVTPQRGLLSLKPPEI